jgi:hypothetical protein
MMKCDLTPLERQILDRSGNSHVTRQRRTLVVASGLGFAALLLAMAFVKRSWQFVLVVALVYIAITVWEKVAYANAVLAYKSLIQKLKANLEEGGSSQPLPGRDA